VKASKPWKNPAAVFQALEVKHCGGGVLEFWSDALDANTPLLHHYKLSKNRTVWY
jgi:hypothetical protein